MAMTTSGPIKRAIVQTLRGSGALVAALTGGIHQRVAPRKVSYPFLTYGLVAAPYIRDWDQVEVHGLFDVEAWAVNSVDAENIDALISAALNEAPLSVDGQTTLLCQRVADLPTNGPTLDGTGKRIFRMGGTYSIWTTQPR